LRLGVLGLVLRVDVLDLVLKKGKGSWICIAPHCEKLTSEALAAQAWITQFLGCKVHHTCLYLVKHSPDGGIAPHCEKLTSEALAAQAWITHFLGCKVHHTCLYLVKHSPDGATTDSDNSHLITAYYSFIDPKRMKG